MGWLDKAKIYSQIKIIQLCPIANRINNQLVETLFSSLNILHYWSHRTWPCSLHWLPFLHHIRHKLLVFAFKVLFPPHISSLIHFWDVNSSPMLWCLPKTWQHSGNWYIEAMAHYTTQYCLIVSLCSAICVSVITCCLVFYTQIGAGTVFLLCMCTVPTIIGSWSMKGFLDSTTIQLIKLKSLGAGLGPQLKGSAYKIQ